MAKFKKKPIGKIVNGFHNRVLKNALSRSKDAPEGSYLPTALSAAIPLWQHHYKDLSFEERQSVVAEIMRDDFCLRLEYVLHKGPKAGDTARAFTDLARAIALLSFSPGGVRAFGVHWEYSRKLLRAEAIA